jgi:hypothetical protein
MRCFLNFSQTILRHAIFVSRQIKPCDDYKSHHDYNWIIFRTRSWSTEGHRGFTPPPPPPPPHPHPHPRRKKPFDQNNVRAVQNATNKLIKDAKLIWVPSFLTLK